MRLTSEQLRAVDLAANHRLCIIHGGPGTGKTTIIKHLVANGTDGGLALLCAPTGNAADRMFKATGLETHVLAKVLHDAKAIARYRGKCNLILDEASMISVYNANQAIAALRPRRVVLVGDTKQLPCMDGFSVLSTLIASGSVPVTNLSFNHRSTDASVMLRVLDAIGDPAKREALALRDDSFRVVVQGTSDEVLRYAAAQFLQAEAGGAQMLALTKAYCDSLNTRTGNASAAAVAKGVHVGDRVVCTRNLYDSATKTLSVANGMLGQVTRTNVVEYENGFRDISGPKRGFRSQFTPARAMTVHKSQGNEFAGLGIIVLGGWRQPSAEFLYTAISRFKSKVLIVGTATDVHEAFHASFRPMTDMYVAQSIAYGNASDTDPSTHARSSPPVA